MGGKSEANSDTASHWLEDAFTTLVEGYKPEDRKGFKSNKKGNTEHILFSFRTFDFRLGSINILA